MKLPQVIFFPFALILLCLAPSQATAPLSAQPAAIILASEGEPRNAQAQKLSLLGLFQDKRSGANGQDVTGNIYAYQYSGIDPTGATDSRAGIQAMIDAANALAPKEKRGAKIVFGPGVFRLDDMVTLGDGQTIECAGRVRTTFRIDSATFNMNALGVFQLPFGDSAQLRDCGIAFVQPNFPGVTRGDVIKYPPGIVATTSPTRFLIDRVRISGAWRCMHLVGNGGGSNIGEVECGALADFSFAEYTASASAKLLTVTAVAKGAIRPDDLAYAIIGASRTTYRIVAQVSGVPGGVGSYQLADAISFPSATNHQTVGGIVIDGPLDFMKISKFNCVFFGIAPRTPLFDNVYIDGKTNCVAFGKVDGLDIKTISALTNSVVFTEGATSDIPYFVGEVQLDGPGSRIMVYDGEVRINKIYSAKSAMLSAPIVLAQGLARVDLNNVLSALDGQTVCSFEARDGGSLTIHSGRLGHLDGSSPVACVRGKIGSVLKIYDTEVNMNNVNRSVAFFTQEGAGSAMQLVGVTSFPERGVSGDAFSFANDNPLNKVVGSTFPGRTHTLSFDTSFGYYDLAEPDAISKPFPGFADNGDFAATINAWSGEYWRKGDHVRAHIALDFSTKAYATASGPFQIIGTGAPKAYANALYGCRLNDVSGVTFKGFQFWPVIQNSVFFLRGASSGAASNLLSTSNITPSTRNIALDFDCDYRVR